jgi:hypothetical protein
MAWTVHLIGTLVHPDAHPDHERSTALQDFALRLARQMHLSLVLHLQGNGAGAPPLLSFALRGQEQGWHVCRGIAEKVAHQLHTLGMSYWATQRRQDRQRQEGR